MSSRLEDDAVVQLELHLQAGSVMGTRFLETSRASYW